MENIKYDNDKYSNYETSNNIDFNSLDKHKNGPANIYHNIKNNNKSPNEYIDERPVDFTEKDKYGNYENTNNKDYSVLNEQKKVPENLYNDLKNFDKNLDLTNEKSFLNDFKEEKSIYITQEDKDNVYKTDKNIDFNSFQEQKDKLENLYNDQRKYVKEILNVYTDGRFFYLTQNDHKKYIGHSSGNRTYGTDDTRLIIVTNEEVKYICSKYNLEAQLILLKTRERYHEPVHEEEKPMNYNYNFNTYPKPKEKDERKADSSFVPPRKIYQNEGKEDQHHSR